MNFKELFIEKYNYIYQNADFICEPYRKIKIEFDDNMIKALDYLLYDDTELKNNVGYIYIENLKNNKEYLKRYKESIKHYDKLINNLKLNAQPKCMQIFLTLYRIINNRKKLDLLDEYARVARYNENGNIYKSGIYLNDDDRNKYKILSQLDIYQVGQTSYKLLKCNEYINYFSNDYKSRNKSIDKAYHFTNEEKRKIFLLNKER